MFDFGNGGGNDNIIYSPCNGLSVFQGSSAFTQPGPLNGGGFNNGVWHHFVWTLTYALLGSATSTWNLYIDALVIFDAVNVLLINCKTWL